MDNSETFIKMCDCLEIQSGKLQILHSDYWCWRSYHGGVFLRGERDPLEMIDHRGKHPRNDRIWLPRQDQLQEMVIDKSLDRPHVDLCYRFYVYAHLNWTKVTSMDQLWVAFVMFELHSKVWIEEKWVKEEK